MSWNGDPYYVNGWHPQYIPQSYDVQGGMHPYETAEAYDGYQEVCPYAYF